MSENTPTTYQIGTGKPGERGALSESQKKVNQLVQTIFSQARDAQLQDPPQFTLDSNTMPLFNRFFTVHETKPASDITYTRNIIATHRLKDPYDSNMVNQKIIFEFHVNDHQPGIERYWPSECIITVKNAGDETLTYAWTPGTLKTIRYLNHGKDLINKIKKKAADFWDVNPAFDLLQALQRSPSGISRRQFLKYTAAGTGAVIGIKAHEIAKPLVAHELTKNKNKREKELLEKAGLGSFYGAYISIRKLQDTYHTDYYSNQLFQVLEGVATGIIDVNDSQVRMLAEGWGSRVTDMTEDALRRARNFTYHGFPEDKLADYKKFVEETAQMYPGAVLVSPERFYYWENQTGGGYTSPNKDAANGLIRYSLNRALSSITLGDVNFSDFFLQVHFLQITLYHEMSHSIDLSDIGFTDVDRLKPYVSQEAFANYLEAYADAINGTLRQWLTVSDDVTAILKKDGLPLRISWLEEKYTIYKLMNERIKQTLQISDEELETWISKYLGYNTDLNPDHYPEDSKANVEATKVQIEWNFWREDICND